MTTQDAHDLSHVPYDLDRAARCFEGDMETGHDIAGIFYETLKDHTDTGKRPVDHVVTRHLWMTRAADLFEGEPLSDGFWLAVMSNAYNALVKDFAAQVREAKEARGAQ